jgi:ABC-2 type transport system permease protein
MSGDVPMTIDLSRVAIIARKEFADHLTDRTFLLMLVLFGILTVLALEQGLAGYTRAMEWYVTVLERTAHSVSSEASLLTSSPNLPSVLWIFLSVGNTLLIFGPVLAIAVGFDLISGERSTRSLRTLLSRPVYRDEVITGKAVGGTAVLVLASAVPYLLALGAVLVAGLTITPYDAMIVALCWGAGVLYLLAYFGVAVAFSAFSEDGGRALAWAMAIFILFSTIVPAVAEDTARSAAGPIPEWPPDDAPPDEIQRYLEERSSYYATYNGVRNTILTLSPNGNYETLIQMLADLHHGGDTAGGAVAELPGLDEVLGRFWQNIVGLIAFPTIFLAVAYVRFMRIDLR